MHSIGIELDVADVLDQWSDFSDESDFSEESEDSSSGESEEEEAGWKNVAGEECYISAHNACIWMHA